MVKKQLGPTVVTDITNILAKTSKKPLSDKEVTEEAKRIGEKHLVKWNVSSTDDPKYKPLLDHVAKKAKVISDHIIKGIEDALDQIFANPTINIKYPRSVYGKASYEFKGENQFYEFKPDEEFKELKDPILETTFRLVNDPKNPKNNGLEFMFRLKEPLKSDSVAFGELLDKLQKMGGIRAEGEDGIYTITFSSKGEILKGLVGLESLKSEPHKKFLKRVFLELQDHPTVEETLKQARKNIEENVKEEQRLFMEKYGNFKLGTLGQGIEQLEQFEKILEQQLDKIFNEREGIKGKIEKLAVLRKLIFSGKFDELLEEMIVKHVAEASTEEISNILAAVANAIGVRPGDLQGFINKKLEEFNKTGVEPLISRTRRIVSESGNLPTIKQAVMDAVEKQIEEQQKSLGQNLVEQDKFLKDFNNAKSQITVRKPTINSK